MGMRVGGPGPRGRRPGGATPFFRARRSRGKDPDDGNGGGGGSGQENGGGGGAGDSGNGSSAGGSGNSSGNGNGNGRAISGGSRLLRWLPVLLLVAGFVFEVSTPARFTGSPFYSAAPLVAAPLYTLRNTILIGVASLATVLGLHFYNGTESDIESVTEMVTITTVTALALLINRAVRRSDRRLASARGIAEAAQRAVLPAPADQIGGLHVAARYEAAHAEASIGGDLYAVQDTPHGVRLIVGDVRGKGLGAVEAVAIVIGAFREAAEQEGTLDRVATRLERALQREGGRREGLDQSEGFTTAVLAEVSPDHGTLRVLNRGHPAPLLLYADGGVRGAEPSSLAMPLGMSELGQWPDRVDELGFPEGATLLLFTDGVTEARDAHGVFYDPKERLRGSQFAGPDALLDALVADVERHTAGAVTDDMALLAVSRPPSPYTP
ncbi:PP2C family protein-serine/threonine phosphatase [Streptomyces pathocidini]|uniref:PP2C family protein-serine/threonine phosphatase n=2 Tax=Streptomyces pathocidini TaxID=1650571 RepID=A0ABW7UX69_9ACTN